MLKQRCKTSPADAFPLAFANIGEEVTLCDLCTNGRLRKRLQDLGLNAGMRVRVMQCDPGCPIILAVANDSRLALGHGMAHKILVKREEA